MNTLTPSLNHCVAALLKAYPQIADIWLLEANAANECALDKPHNLIIIATGEQEAHLLEQEARDLVDQQFETASIDVFVFPMAAIERMPRPLLVKMALTSGENIYCG